MSNNSNNSNNSNILPNLRSYVKKTKDDWSEIFDLNLKSVAF